MHHILGNNRRRFTLSRATAPTDTAPAFSFRGTSLLHLPNELILDIINYIPTRHHASDSVVEVKNLAALAATCRRLHWLVTPFLFRNVVIHNDKSLRELSMAPQELLQLIQEMNLFMDVDFLLDFRAASKAPQSVTDSTIFSLARILSSTSHLSSLRIRVARSSGPDSAWIRSSRSIYTATDGIPIGKALVRASKYFPISLPSLKSLEIDMLSDIAPILQAAPNLGYLRLYASGGYSQAVNKRLVESLKYVPQLEALVYSPESLKMTSDLEEAEAELAQEGHEGAQPLVQTNVDRSAELVGALGKVLPNIKSLDLRRRTHGEETEFTPCDNPISSQALLKAMENLRGLRHLYLPTSLFSEADFEAFQLAFKSDAAEEDFNMSAQAINHVMVVERAAVQSMGAIAETLRSVAFVRPLDSRDADEMSYEYRLRVVGAQRSVSRTSGMTTLVPARVDFVGPPVVRPAWAEVADPGFNTAGDYSRRPGAHVQMAPVGFSWRQRGLEFVEEHPGAGIAAAVASGIILSEASRAFYSR